MSRLTEMMVRSYFADADRPVRCVLALGSADVRVITPRWHIDGALVRTNIGVDVEPGSDALTFDRLNLTIDGETVNQAIVGKVTVPAGMSWSGEVTFGISEVVA